MIDFYVNPLTGDIELDENGDIRMIEGDDELIQCVVDIITTNLGEWIFNPQHGFARFRVLGQKFDKDEISSELVAAILQEERVASVDSLDWTFDRSTRVLSGTFTLTKANGGQVEGSF